jgi:hypothetical protein
MPEAGRLPVPTTRFTIYYRGATPIPAGTPRQAEWIPDWTEADIRAQRCYRLFIPGGIYTNPEEWLAAVADLKAGTFPEPPTNPQPDPFADEGSPEDQARIREQVAAANRALWDSRAGRRD